jgi:hypothetical protein
MATLNKDTVDGIKRKAYTTHLDPELIKKFKIYCVENEKNQYEVLEQLLTDLLNKEGGDNGNTNR